MIKKLMLGMIVSLAMYGQLYFSGYGVAPNTGDTATGYLRFYELRQNGQQYVEIKVPTSIGTSYTITLPSAAPASNDYCLKASTAGVASWASCAAGGAGTVTSVGLTLPSIFSVTGSPVTTSGTLAATLADQSANTVLAGPTTGAATTPAFRALVAADIPSLSATYLALASAAAIATSGSASDLTTGTVPAGRMPALTGDVTSSSGSVATTVVKINGTSLAGLATGVLKNTTTTGVPSIATVTDITAPLYCADAGASDTYTCSLSPAPAAYATGAVYQFKANTANTGAATINFNSLGAKTIVKVAGGVTTTLADNDIRSGQVVTLTYDGTNMQMQSTLGNAASGTTPGMILLEQYTASSSSALNFTSCLSSTYDTYKITFTAIKTSSNGVYVGIQVSTDGGSSYVTSASYVYRIIYWNTASAQDNNASATNMRLFQATATAASPNLNAEVTYYNPLGSSGYKSFTVMGSTLTDSGTVAAGMLGTGYYAAETAVNAFRVIPESGTLASGTVRCYGLAK